MALQGIAAHEQKGSALMSFVYLIASGRNIIKVGKADDVRKRVRGLQTASPFEMQIFHTIEVSSEHVGALEKLIHKRLKRYHLRGEWFCIERALAVSIAQKAANQFGKDRAFAQVDEQFQAETSVKCLACGHTAVVTIAPRPRIKFRCSKCTSSDVAVTV